MSAARKLKIMNGANVLAIVMQKSVTINAEPIDITDDEDNGWRALDDDVGLRSVDLSIEGVTKDNDLRAAILGLVPSVKYTGLRIVYPNGDTLVGDYFMTSFEESGPQNDALKFSASLQSSGPQTFTAA